MIAQTKAPSTIRTTCFPTTPRNLKTQRTGHIEMCFRKTGAGKSNGHRDAIVFKNICFQNFSIPAHENGKPAF